MKALYVITRADRGGGQVHVLSLLKAFRPDIELHLATGEEGWLCEEARKLSIAVHRIRNLTQPINPIKDAIALVETNKLIAKVNPDLIHAHTSKAGLIARLAARMRRVPCVFTAHTWSFADGIERTQQWISRPLERLAARAGGPIITVSEANRLAAIQAGIATPEGLITIWNGMPDSAERAVPEYAGTPTITMIARFVQQKNQLLLLRALSKITDLYKLVFVGDGPMRSVIEEETVRLRMDGRVEFAGERNDVDVILGQSQMFVLSTNWEGLPLSIIEAMRAGLPVIASDVGGVAEVVRHAESGYLVKRGDEEDLRQRLQELISSPLLRLRMGRAGRELFQRSFTLDQMLDRTATVYQAAMGTVARLEWNAVAPQAARRP